MPATGHTYGDGRQNVLQFVTKGAGQTRAPAVQMRAGAPPASRDISMGGKRATLNPKMAKQEETVEAPSWTAMVTKYMSPASSSPTATAP
eukprot:7973316-Pyramimonas_sp.AAC.1